MDSEQIDITRWRVIGGQRMHLARKAARGGKGYTFRDISEALPQFSISRLHGYESGYRGMDPQVAVSLGQFLGVSAAYLLCVDGGLDHVDDVDDEARFFLQRWKTSNPTTKEIVRDILAHHAG